MFRPEGSVAPLDVPLPELEEEKPQSKLRDCSLAEVCSVYWQSLYDYARRLGSTHHDAQDLVQGFIVGIIEKDSGAGFMLRIDRPRAYLLRSLKNYITNEWEKGNAQKRGGQYEHIPLNIEHGSDSNVAVASSASTDPEVQHDHRWAMSLVVKAAARLQTIYEREERGTCFRVLAPYLTMDHTHRPYAETAHCCDSFADGEAVRKAVHRFRRRFEKCLREEVETTVATASSAQNEMWAIFASFEDLAW